MLTVDVQIEGGLQPGAAFDRVRTRVTEESEEVFNQVRPVSEEDDFVSGQRVAEIAITSGQYEVIVVLESADRPVAQYGTRVNLEGPYGVLATFEGERCERNAEVCNGIDDDCDGTVDEAPESLCTLPNANATRCTVAGCEIDACMSGYLDCDGLSDNGCEIYSLTDGTNCGECGLRCDEGEACERGVCRGGGSLAGQSTGLGGLGAHTKIVSRPGPAGGWYVLRGAEVIALDAELNRRWSDELEVETECFSVPLRNTSLAVTPSGEPVVGLDVRSGGCDVSLRYLETERDVVDLDGQNLLFVRYAAEGTDAAHWSLPVALRPRDVAPPAVVFGAPFEREVFAFAEGDSTGNFVARIELPESDTVADTVWLSAMTIERVDVEGDSAFYPAFGGDSVGLATRVDYRVGTSGLVSVDLGDGAEWLVDPHMSWIVLFDLDGAPTGFERIDGDLLAFDMDSAGEASALVLPDAPARSALRVLRFSDLLQVFDIPVFSEQPQDVQLVVGPLGDLYLAGRAIYGVDFGGGYRPVLFDTAFVVAYGVDGTYRWDLTTDGAAPIRFLDLALSSGPDIGIAAEFETEIDLGGGPTTMNALQVLGLSD